MPKVIKIHKKIRGLNNGFQQTIYVFNIIHTRKLHFPNIINSLKLNKARKN